MNPGKSDTYVGDPVVGRDDNGGDLAYIAWPVQNKGCGPSTFWVPNTERHAMYSVRQIDILGQVFRSLVQIRGSQDHVPKFRQFLASTYLWLEWCLSINGVQPTEHRNGVT